MRSRRETHMLPGAGVLLIAALTAAAPLPESVLQAAGPQPSAVEITNAIEAVKKDPNFDTEVTVRTLRWTGKNKPGKKAPDWAIFAWLREFVRWLDRSARLLMWAAVAILVIWLAIYISRLVNGRSRRGSSAETFVAPTHVRDLDIRPEALPPNIGAAARALWDRGDHRAALALLYRGLLSRLVHKHRVPIRDSSTEGDCLALAADHLDEEARRDYATRLIRIWQHAVYGSQDPAPAAFYELCDAFAQSLDRVAASEPAASPSSGGAA